MPAPLTDQAVNAAKDLPDLITKLSAADPALAQQLTGKALIASKTVWGTLATMAISWAVTKWGLGWDANTSAEVSGALVMVATVLLRKITTSPIASVLPGAKPASATQPAAPAA